MWYVLVNGVQQGPLSVDQLKAGGVRPDTMVFGQGMTTWTPAGQVPPLASLFAPAPQSFVAPAPPPPLQPAGQWQSAPGGGVMPGAVSFGAQPVSMPTQQTYGGAPAQQNGANVQAASVFAGIEGAHASGDSNYVRPGTYIVQVVRCKMGRAQLKGEFFAVEMKCIRVIDDGRLDPGGSRPHFVGEEFSHMMMKMHASFLGNVKSAIGGILEIPADRIDAEVTMQVMAAVTSDQQPLSNRFIEIYAHTIMTRGGGGKPPAPFTKVAYKRRIPAADIKVYLAQTDPSGQAEARLFPAGLLDRIVAYEQSQGIAARGTMAAPVAAQGAPAFGGAPPTQPVAPPAAQPQWGAQPGQVPTSHQPGPSWGQQPVPAVPPPPAQPQWGQPPATMPAAQPAFVPGPMPGGAPPTQPGGFSFPPR